MKRKRQAAALLAALMLAAAVPQAGAAEVQPSTEPPAQAAEAQSPEEAPAEAEEVWKPNPGLVDLDSWNMLLVNPWNTLPEGFTVELAKLSNGLQVDKRIAEELNAMLEGCRQAGLRPLVCSAYRSYAKQRALHYNKIARLRNSGWNWDDAPREAARWVAVPGTSEHQTGMAVDIVASSYQVLNRRQENTAEQKWLMEHCWEYGFILRYPSDKCDVTGIGYEPWHYRYVGREIAQDIRASGLCLEEYIEVMRAAQAAAPQTVEKLPAEPEAGAAEETVAMDGQTADGSKAAAAH